LPKCYDQIFFYREFTRGITSTVKKTRWEKYKQAVTKAARDSLLRTPQTELDIVKILVDVNTAHLRAVKKKREDDQERITGLQHGPKLPDGIATCMDYQEVRDSLDNLMTDLMVRNDKNMAMVEGMFCETLKGLKKIQKALEGGEDNQEDNL
jgi:hypothetical protein